MIQFVLASIICLLDLEAQSKEFVLGMNLDEVAIIAIFDRSGILLFGAIMRVTEIPEGIMYVIVTILGPLLLVIVPHKERTYGIWANRDMVVVDAASSF